MTTGGGVDASQPERKPRSWGGVPRDAQASDGGLRVILGRVLADALNPRHRSLVRGTVIVLASFVLAFVLSDFPRNRATVLLAIPAIASIVGTFDTIRCIQRRWSFYHAGVVLCIYMDLMAVSMILFLFLYPYALWVSQTR